MLYPVPNDYFRMVVYNKCKLNRRHIVTLLARASSLDDFASVKKKKPPLQGQVSKLQELVWLTIALGIVVGEPSKQQQRRFLR